jgi:glutamine phosphoribosylpyrophosphate amidotransferase
MLRAANLLGLQVKPGVALNMRSLQPRGEHTAGIAVGDRGANFSYQYNGMGRLGDGPWRLAKAATALQGCDRRTMCSI